MTVLLDGSDGAGIAAWEEVADRLEEFVRVVSYDRAGYGRSDFAPTPPTADDSAQDLHAALAHVGLGAPFLLVGHGYGASVMRLFAHRYRREVIGMVLVDPRPEGFAALAPASWRRSAERARRRLALLAFLSRLGVLKLWGARAARPRAAADAPNGQRGSARSGEALARYGEAALLAESDREVASLPVIGDMPLVVIRHDRPDLFEGLPAGDALEAEALWERLQRQLTATSTRGSLQVAVGAGHDVPSERPDVVVHAVLEVLGAAGFAVPAGD